MFPIRDDNPQFLVPYATYGIIFLNVIGWFFIQGMGKLQKEQMEAKQDT